MRINSTILALTLLAAVPAVAQRGGEPYRGNYDYMQQQNAASILSVYSEDNEPFFLVLNGEKQNIQPQTKIRVEALPKYLNNVEILFADRNMPSIHKAVMIADPVDDKAVNLTLKIVRSRQGPRLKFVRMAEIEHNYRGPRDEYVMYYGKPGQVNTVTETTYTDPATGQVVTQTTTTTTTGGNSYNNYNGGTNPPPAPPIVRTPAPIDDRTFADMKKSVQDASFENTKLSTAQTVVNMNYVTTDQVIELCKQFSFENTRLNFAQSAYSRTVDPQNYFKVASVLDFDSNKKALNDFIAANHK